MRANITISAILFKMDKKHNVEYLCFHLSDFHKVVAEETVLFNKVTQQYLLK